MRTGRACGGPRRALCTCAAQANGFDKKAADAVERDKVRRAAAEPDPP